MVSGCDTEDLAVVGPPFWDGLLCDPLVEGLSGELAIPMGATAVYSSCTSALHALLLASLALASDPTRSALVVAVDALSLSGIAGFNAAGAASPTDCRPMTVERDGMLVGEGAAAILFEPACKHHSITPHLLGAGVFCEKFHPTRPDPSGEGFERAIRQALSRAALTPSDIAGIILHGTGTAANDEAEANAVLRIFERSTPATSLKAALGHTMGASVLFNCLCAIEAIRNGVLPPTTLGEAPGIDGVDLVQGGPRPLTKGKAILVNGAAFGGNYGAAIIGYCGGRG